MVSPTSFDVNNQRSSCPISPSVKEKNQGKEEAEEGRHVVKETPFPLKELSLVESLPSSSEIGLLCFLYGRDVIDNKGFLLLPPDKTKLPPLNDEQVKDLRDLLDEPFDVKDKEGRVIKKVSIRSLVQNFLENLPEGFEVTEINLIGGYLVHLLLHKYPKYRESLFGKFPEEVQSYLRNYFENKTGLEPNDIDIRIKIRHKKYAAEQVKDVELDEILRFFLGDLGPIEKVSFEKLGRVNPGYNKFRIVSFKGCKKEFSLCVLALRDYLFSLDGYFLPLQELFSNKKAELTPRCYTDKEMQGLVDTTLGIIRTEKVEDIDYKGFFRMISLMTKGKSAGQEGIIKTLGKDVLKVAYLDETIKCLESHHGKDLSEHFAYLLNFTYFAQMSDGAAVELWTEFYKGRKRPEERWVRQVVEQVVDKKVPFSKVIGTLNTGFYLCAAAEGVSELTVDMDHCEFNKEVYKVRIGTSTVQLIYDHSKEMSLESDQLALLQSIIAKKPAGEPREHGSKGHQRPAGLGLLSCFLKKDLTESLEALLMQVQVREKEHQEEIDRAESLEALLMQVREKKYQEEIDRAVRIALSIVEHQSVKQTSENLIISHGLIYLVTKGSDEEVVKQLMALGVKKNLIRKEGKERTLGWLRLLDSYHKKHQNIAELIERFEKLKGAKQVVFTPEVGKLFTRLLSAEIPRQTFDMLTPCLLQGPLTDASRQQLLIDAMEQYLANGNLVEAFEAFKTLIEKYPLNEKRGDLIRDMIRYLEKKREKTPSEFCVVEKAFGIVRGLAPEEECSLLSRFISASVSLILREKWKPGYELMQRLLERMQEIPMSHPSSLTKAITFVVEEMRSPDSSYSGLKIMMRKALPRFLWYADGEDVSPYYFFFQEVRKTYLSFEWSDEHSDKVKDLWCKIGREAVKEGDVCRVRRCFQELNAAGARDLYSDAVDLFVKQGEVEDAIELLEKVYSLDKSSFDKIWIKYLGCFSQLKVFSKRVATLIKSPIVQRANYLARNVVEECAEKLLAPSSISKKSVSLALELLLRFMSLFGPGDEGLWLMLLKGLKIHHPKMLSSAMGKIESMLVGDPKVQIEAWMTALPNLLEEKSEIVLQFVVDDKLPPALTEEIKEKTDSVAVEVCAGKSFKQRRLVLEMLLTRKRLNFEGNMMLISDYILHGQQKEVIGGVVLMLDHYVKSKSLLKKYFEIKGHSLEVEMMMRLMSFEKPQVSLILSLLAFMNYDDLIKIDFLPILECWLEMDLSDKMSDLDLISLSKIISKNFTQRRYNNQKELRKRLATVVSSIELLKKIAIDRESLQKNVEFLRNIRMIYQVLDAIEINPQSLKDDLLWKCLYFAFEPGRFGQDEIMNSFCPFALYMLKKKGKIDDLQERVVGAIFRLFSFWLPMSSKPDILLEFLGDLFELCKNPLNQENDKPNSLFFRRCSEYIHKACENTHSSTKVLWESCIVVLGKYLIPNFYYLPGEIIDLIELCFKKGLEIAKNEEIAREHERGYYELYKHLFEHCLLEKNALPLFRIICRKLHSEAHDVEGREGSCYVRAIPFNARSLKREIRIELFRHLRSQLLKNRHAGVAPNSETFCKFMEILIFYYKDIIRDDWYLGDPLVVIEMMKEVMPELCEYFSQKDYDEELDLCRDMVNFAIESVPRYLLSSDKDNNEPKILRFPRHLLREEGQELCKYEEFQQFFHVQAHKVLCQWRECLESLPKDKMAGARAFVEKSIFRIEHTFLPEIRS